MAYKIAPINNQMSLEKLVSPEMKKKILKEYIEPYALAGEKASIEIRNNIAIEWFASLKSKNYDSFINAIDKRHYTRFDKDGNGKIFIHTWIDPEKYNPNQSIQSWDRMNKYGDIDKVERMEYVLSLQINEGILGLPEKGSEPHNEKGDIWKNKDFRQGAPMRDYIYSTVRWSNFDNLVKKYFMKGGI